MTITPDTMDILFELVKRRIEHPVIISYYTEDDRTVKFDCYGFTDLIDFIGNPISFGMTVKHIESNHAQFIIRQISDIILDEIKIREKHVTFVNAQHNRRNK